MADEKSVWVIQTHEGWGEGADVLGVFASEEAARTALEKRPNMEVFTAGGQLRGRPVDENAYPHTWAVAEKYQVEG